MTISLNRLRPPKTHPAIPYVSHANGRYERAWVDIDGTYVQWRELQGNLKLTEDAYGHPLAWIPMGSYEAIPVRVAEIVAFHHLDAWKGGHRHVIHLDHNPKNNTRDNLRLVSQGEAHKHYANRPGSGKAQVPRRVLPRHPAFRHGKKADIPRETVIAIVECHRPVHEIVEKFKVSETTVVAIRNGRTRVDDVRFADPAKRRKNHHQRRLSLTPNKDYTYASRPYRQAVLVTPDGQSVRYQSGHMHGADIPVRMGFDGHPFVEVVDVAFDKYRFPTRVQKCLDVALIVAVQHVPNRHGHRAIIHIDGNTANVHADNLRWVRDHNSGYEGSMVPDGGKHVIDPTQPMEVSTPALRKRGRKTKVTPDMIASITGATDRSIRQRAKDYGISASLVVKILKAHKAAMSTNPFDRIKNQLRQKAKREELAQAERARRETSDDISRAAQATEALNRHEQAEALLQDNPNVRGMECWTLLDRMELATASEGLAASQADVEKWEAAATDAGKTKRTALSEQVEASELHEWALSKATGNLGPTAAKSDPEVQRLLSAKIRADGVLAHAEKYEDEAYAKYDEARDAVALFRDRVEKAEQKIEDAPYAHQKAIEAYTQAQEAFGELLADAGHMALVNDALARRKERADVQAAKSVAEAIKRQAMAPEVDASVEAYLAALPEAKAEDEIRERLREQALVKMRVEEAKHQRQREKIIDAAAERGAFQ